MGVIGDILKMELHGNGDKSRRKLTYMNGETSEVGVLKSALLTGLAMLALGLTQMLLTMYYPISPYSNPVSVYIRNITMFLANGITGLFLIFWYNFVSEYELEYRKTKGIRIVAIIAIIICLVKGVYSFYIVYYQSHQGFYLVSRYVTDGVAWIAMALFVMVYYHHVLTNKHHKVNLKRYKVFCIVVTVISCIQTCLAIQYTIMKYTPYYVIWVYYLATAIAWFLLSVFFSFYCSSKLVYLPEVYHEQKKSDSAKEEAMEKAAKVQANKTNVKYI